jgi:hypothetical protein
MSQDKVVTFTDAERNLLGEVIDQHLEGIDSAFTETVADRTIETADDLLELTSNLADDRATLQSIRGRLRDE